MAVQKPTNLPGVVVTIALYVLVYKNRFYSLLRVHMDVLEPRLCRGSRTVSRGQFFPFTVGSGHQIQIIGIIGMSGSLYPLSHLAQLCPDFFFLFLFRTRSLRNVD